VTPGATVISRLVQDCQVCGRRFDPRAFQVVVPELGRGFDRFECAQSARARALPAALIAAAPLAAVVQPIGALAPASRRAPALRPFATLAAALGFLGAGTAAAALLWLRVLGSDPAAFTFPQAPAAPAVGQETVQANVPEAPEGTGLHAARTPTERPVPDSVTTVLIGDRQASEASTPTGKRGSKSSTPRSKVTPTRTARPAARPAARTTSSTVKSTGKGHVKRGKGHYKHGETSGVHRPGHGRSKHH
jgi:hypothetical protein